ncbi:glucuronosyltransferase [Caenorhabditis elegans]|uniref:glucuronosyltransferase n=1 Tax=Caenorhabditis elegans TaxID=6239 RepID=O16916_CAEEL|nr:glucuronosyltransferase [Caenorhabditis elegans]CCD69121.1 glucuronosyltransferase [Caenorhabditis elegans]|eukprot:NP_504812.1 UDP-GlucuronosylTransferase [Caenorhabditis elegans]
MLLLALLFTLYANVSSFNFLVFCPLFAHSHSKFFATIADSLTDAGHNVAFFTPIIVEKYRNFNYTKSTKDVVYMEPSKKLKEYGRQMSTGDFVRYWTEDSTATEIITVVRIFQKMYNEQGTVMKDNIEILNDLKKRKFDVIIFEAFIFSAYPLMDYLEIPTFIPSLSVAHDTALAVEIGEPVMPSVVSDCLSPFGDKLSITERAFNAFMVPYFDFMIGYPTHRSFKPPYNPIDIRSIVPEASFVFLNSNPFVDFPRPTLTKTIQIGGISVDSNELRSQKLDETWSEILKLREKTMLVSFGSMLYSKDMPFKNKIALKNAMEKFKNVTFIWKYEDDSSDEFAKGIENIHFAKWVPQTALLADSRLSAFLTHAGLGSITELSYLGKPAILCPQLFDQMRNTKMLVRHNGSIELSKYDLGKSEKIIEAFQAILFDSSYAKNAQKLAEQLENQPIKPKEMMVKHAEYAARFGRLPSLDPYSRKMSFVEYFLLDVAAICVFILTFVVFVVTKLVQSLFDIFLIKRKTE